MPALVFRALRSILGVLTLGRLQVVGRDRDIALVRQLVTSILLIDDLEDRQFDASKGWRTLAVCFGPAGSRLAYCFFSLLAYLAPLVLWSFGGYGAWVLLPLVTMPLAVRILPIVLTHEDEPTLEPMTARAGGFNWSTQRFD